MKMDHDTAFPAVQPMNQNVLEESAVSSEAQLMNRVLQEELTVSPAAQLMNRVLQEESTASPAAQLMNQVLQEESTVFPAAQLIDRVLQEESTTLPAAQLINRVLPEESTASPAAQLLNRVFQEDSTASPAAQLINRVLQEESTASPSAQLINRVLQEESTTSSETQLRNRVLQEESTVSPAAQLMNRVLQEESTASPSAQLMNRILQEESIQTQMETKTIIVKRSSAFNHNDLKPPMYKRVHFNTSKLSIAQQQHIGVHRAYKLGLPKPPRYGRNKSRTVESQRNPQVSTSSVPQTNIPPSSYGATWSGNAANEPPTTHNAPTNSQKSAPDKNSSVSAYTTTCPSNAANESLTAENVATNSQDLIKHKMAVVPRDYPKVRFNDATSLEVKKYLIEAIFKITDGIAPTFLDNYNEKGAVIIICDSDYSRQWLEKTVRHVGYRISVEIRVGLASDIINTVRGIFWVSKEFRSLIGGNEPKKLISLLKVQNPKLNIRAIYIISVKDDSKGSTFEVALDHISVNALKETRYKLSLGLEKTPVKVIC